MASSESRWDIKVSFDVKKSENNKKEKFINEYCILDVLGEGSFGKVHLCERRQGTPYRQFAMKKMDKNKLDKMKKYTTDQNTMKMMTELDRVHLEVNIMRHLYHPNIVIMFELLESSKKLYFILEYMSKGPCMVYDAHQRLFKSPLTQSSLTEELAKQHLADIVHGVQYLHSRNIVHRDIKPSNILLNDNNRCHLADFGCAHQFHHGSSLLRDTVGTYHFTAPECCTGEYYDGYKADIWSIGITLYIMLLGRLPFDAETTQDLFQLIQEKPLSIERDTTLSSEAIELVALLLDKNPNTRLSLQDTLEHPWLSEDPPSF